MAPSLPPHPPPPRGGGGCPAAHLPPGPTQPYVLGAVGAGQAVSSHLRQWLVTAGRKLLWELSMWLGWATREVHAVQDADLGEHGLSGHASFSQPSGGLSLHPCPPHPRPTPPPPPRPASLPLPTARVQESPARAAVSTFPATRGLSRTPIPAPRPGGGSGGGLKGGSSSYLHDEFIAGVTPIHFLSRRAGTSWRRGCSVSQAITRLPQDLFVHSDALHPWEPEAAQSRSQ